MIKYRIVDKPAFDVVGKRTWIAGQDNELFGRFWAQCAEERLFEQFERLNHQQPGEQTGSSLLGVSCVERDPSDRAFYYMIAIERPEQSADSLEVYHVPAARWAVFECVGKIPDALVRSEMYAFTEWLPASDYQHANAPEMEVYFAGNDGQSDDSYCEFWLPISAKQPSESP